MCNDFYEIIVCTMIRWKKEPSLFHSSIVLTTAVSGWWSQQYQPCNLKTNLQLMSYFRLWPYDHCTESTVYLTEVLNFTLTVL